MLKNFSEERQTTHYSGRDYDQLNAKIQFLEHKQQIMKSNLLSKLTEVLRGQDDQVIKNIFSAVDQVVIS